MTKESKNKKTNKETTEAEKKPQPGMFRVGGLAAFVILTAGVGAAGYFGTAPLIKSVLTSQISAAVGAETNIDGVEVTWSSFGLSINGFRQADPDALNRNLFEFKRAAFKIDPFELLVGNTIIDSLAIDGVKFDTARSSVAEVIESETAEEEVAETSSEDLGSSIDVPSVDDVLAKADLQTEAKAKQLEQVWKEEKAASEKALANIPDKSVLKSYEAQWKEIENAEIKSLDDIKSLKAKLKKLKADIKNDKKALSIAKKQLKESRKNIDTAYDELKVAPGQDWKAIKQQLPIDDPNAVAISKLLFGDEIAGYVEQAESLYAKVKPFMSSSGKADEPEEPGYFDGKNIEFELAEKWPSWLVKSLVVDFESPSGLAFKLTANDLTSENYVRDEASTYKVELHSDAVNESFALNGDYFIDVMKELKATGNWQATGISVDEKSLADSSDLKVVMANSTLAGEGGYQYENSRLNSFNNLKFANVDIDGQGNTKLASMMFDTLKTVEQFTLNVGVAGKVSRPAISIKSDLDNQLNSAVRKQVSAEWQELETKTKSRLQGKMQDALNLNEGDLAKWNELKAQIDDAEGSLKQFGEDKLESLLKGKQDALEKKLKDKAEDELKDKAKEKLKDKLKDFKCCD